MLGIFAKTFRTATRHERWDAPDHWKPRPRAKSAYAQERDELHARLRAMRSTGMW